MIHISKRNILISVFSKALFKSDAKIKEKRSFIALRSSNGVFSKKLFLIMGLFEENCRSISAKPTGIKKDKDIPGLPEN